MNFLLQLVEPFEPLTRVRIGIGLYPNWLQALFSTTITVSLIVIDIHWASM